MVGQVSKHCGGCGQDKPLDDFQRRTSAHDGKQSQCRECMKRRSRRWHADNQERIREYDAEWWAKNRETALAKKKALNATPEEKERNRERRRRYRENNPERVQELARLARQRNAASIREKNRRQKTRRRGLTTVMLGGFSTAYMRQVEAELLAQACSYCGSDDGVTVDHVVPLSRGGLHHPQNLSPACAPCNRSKNAKLLSEWQRPATSSLQIAA